MNKFITTAAFLAASIALASAAETWTVSNSATATVSNAYFNGIAFNLGADEGTSRLTISGETDLTADSVLLTSLTTNIRSLTGQGNEASGNTSVYLMVCDSSQKILGVSTNAFTTTGTATLNFNNIEISTTDTVRVYFITGNSYSSAMSAIGETAADTSWLLRAGASTLISYATSGTTTDSTTNQDSLYMLGNSNSGGKSYTTEYKTYFAPSISLSLQPVSPIPEPSAFGLLAGAGALVLVAARRRRRSRAK